MRMRLLWRRAAAALGIYGSALLGILASIVAARELSKIDFSRFALVFAATSLLQLFLDLTIEEVVVKYGNRYAARADWGRFHRLIRLSIRIKLAGGLLGTVGVAVVAFASPWIWSLGGIRGALLVAGLIPLIQAPEGIASALLLLRNRYDIRGGLLTWSMALRLAATAIGASFGLVQAFIAIVIAQVVSTVTSSVVAYLAYRRYPRRDVEPLAEHSREVRAFAVQSTIGSGLSSLRTLLPTVLVGMVAKPEDIGYFRIAQAPQTAFASLSAPARLVLLAEQTRDIEHGRADRAYRLLWRYIAATFVAAAVLVPAAWYVTPALVPAIYGHRYAGAINPTRLILIAASVQLVFGWTKSFPVSIGRPGLRTAGQLVEIVAMIPLVVVLGSMYGATGAAAGVVGSSLALGLFWIVNLSRLRLHTVSAGAAT